MKNASSEPMTDEELTEVLESFIAQHYIGREVPRMIVSTLEFDVGRWPRRSPPRPTAKSTCSATHRRKARVAANGGGERAPAIAAKSNARATRAMSVCRRSSRLDLPEGTQRLECFDISHTMGEATVASAWCSTNAMQTGPVPSLQHPDGERRRRLRRDERGAHPPRRAHREGRSAAPDVWVIDGGKGKSASPRRCSPRRACDIVLFGSAKAWSARRAWSRSCSPHRDDTIRLPADHPGLHLIQQMQDESHRFAIQGHAPAAKAREGSAPDDIEGHRSAQRARC